LKGWSSGELQERRGGGIGRSGGEGEPLSWLFSVEAVEKRISGSWREREGRLYWLRPPLFCDLSGVKRESYNGRGWWSHSGEEQLRSEAGIC
jgi:hypothetical protein